MSGLRFWQDLVDKTPALDDKLLLGVDNQNVPSYCTVDELLAFISSSDINVPAPQGNVIVGMGDGSLTDSGVNTSQLELNTNKVTSVDSNSTDTEYPSAKAVYTAIGNIPSPTFNGVAGNLVDFSTADTLGDSGVATNTLELNTNKVTSINSTSTDTQYPSAKAVYTAIDNIPLPTFTGTNGNIPTFNNGALQDSGLAPSTFEEVVNKVTSLSSTSTDIEYPTAKATYTALNNLANSIPTGGLGIPEVIDKESNLPSASSVANGTYYVVQDMDITSPGSQGHVWVNNGVWVKIIDTAGTPDLQTIIYNTANEYAVNLVGIIDTNTMQVVNDTIGVKLGSYLQENGGVDLNASALLDDIIDHETLKAPSGKITVQPTNFIDNNTLNLDTWGNIQVDLQNIAGLGLMVQGSQLVLSKNFSFSQPLYDNGTGFITLLKDNTLTIKDYDLLSVNTPNIIDPTYFTTANNLIQPQPNMIPPAYIVNITQNSSGVITVVYNKTPQAFTVQTLAGVIIGGNTSTSTNAVNGQVTKTFTPTTASDITNGGWTVIGY